MKVWSRSRIILKQSDGRRQSGNWSDQTARNNFLSSSFRSGRTRAARQEVNWTLIVAAWIASFVASYRLKEQKKRKTERKEKTWQSKLWGSRCRGYSIGTLLFMSQGRERGWMGGGGSEGGIEGGMEGGWGVERQILCVNYSRSNNSMWVWWGLRVLQTHTGRDAHKRKNAQQQSGVKR